MLRLSLELDASLLGSADALSPDRAVGPAHRASFPSSRDAEGCQRCQGFLRLWALPRCSLAHKTAGNNDFTFGAESQALRFSARRDASAKPLIGFGDPLLRAEENVVFDSGK
jgi:hypothetical protein